MEEVKWIRLSTGLFDNRKIRQIEQLPDGDTIIIIWLKLLILAGEVNDGGLVYFTRDIPFTEQLLSTEFGRPLPVVQLALKTFVSFGMIEIVDELIRVTNWERYQSVEGLERIREQNRIRKQRQRDNARLPDGEMSRDSHVTVTQQIRIDKKEIREEKKRTIQTAIADLSVSDALKQTLKDFAEMRSKIKRPLTDRGLSILMTKLNGIATDEKTQIAILDQSIVHDWQSVYPLKEKPTENDPELDAIFGGAK